MAKRDYIPHVLAVFHAWVINYSTKISATPVLYGTDAATALVLANLTADFLTRYATGTNPDTRTKSSILALKISHKALVAKCRQIARVINAAPTTTDTMRSDLGLTVRDVEPTPTPVPMTRPFLKFEGAKGMEALLLVKDETTPQSRKKPDGIALAALLMKIVPAGAPAPTLPEEYQFAGLTSRSSHVLELPGGNAGKTLWVMARWYNERCEPGPFSDPVGVMIAA